VITVIEIRFSISPRLSYCTNAWMAVALESYRKLWVQWLRNAGFTEQIVLLNQL